MKFFTLFEILESGRKDFLEVFGIDRNDLRKDKKGLDWKWSNWITRQVCLVTPQDIHIKGRPIFLGPLSQGVCAIFPRPSCDELPKNINVSRQFPLDARNRLRSKLLCFSSSTAARKGGRDDLIDGDSSKVDQYPNKGGQLRIR